MKAIHFAYNLLVWVRNAAIIIALGAMVANIFIGVVFRYGLNNSLSWTEELARYLMVWMGFLGMGLAMKDGEHVGVRFFYDRIPQRLQPYVTLINRLIVMVFLVVLCRYSVAHLKIVKLQTSPAMQIPMYLPYSAITIGSLFMIIENLRHILLRTRE